MSAVAGQVAEFTRRLLRWYARHGRGLPWRRNPTPYRVWISEIMLQQTVVGAVKRRFEEWVERFPDAAAVARSTPEQALAAWEGLGYYRRATNAHRAARLIVQRHAGELPRAHKELLALPGIGPYVASAIRSLAFGEDEVAVEANVTRVFMRLLALKGHARDGGVHRAVSQRAQRALPRGRSADYNQALMDFGSLICLPRRPGCERCFAASLCEARRKGLQNDIPRRRAGRLRKIHTAVAVFLKDGRLYLQRRPDEGLFAGMWELPGGKVERGECPADALVREVHEELGARCRPLQELPPIVHCYTVFRVTLHPFLCSAPRGLPIDEDHLWVPLDQIGEYPMPSANRKLLSALEERPRSAH